MVKTLYLVLDLMNDIVHAEGPNGGSPTGEQIRQRRILENTAAALARARAAGALVGYVRVGFSDGYVECPPASPIFTPARERGLFKLGTWGTEIHPDVAPRAHDFDIVKHRVSAFYGTKLELVLRAHAVTRLVLSGVSTTAVVQSTARDAHDRDYECVVLEDGCAAPTAQEHDQSIAMLRRYAHISSSSDFVFASP